MPFSTPFQTHFQPGHRLDQRYELLCPVAQGGMAVVWVSRVVGKLGLEKLYAVKAILPSLSADDGFRAMFLDEARIASRIRHPNVVALEDLGEEEGQLFMVLEWVQGDSLARLATEVDARGAALPQDILLRIVADACAGLHAAHELPADDGRPLHVVHRDISPQNLLVTTAGITKVIDFGIATALDRVSERTKSGQLKGKLHYASPEQVRTMQLDRGADIWALGVVLYQYLAGRLPYTAERDIDIVAALVSDAPPPPLPPSVSRALSDVVLTALRPRRDDRFATALDMQRALEACLSAPTTTTDVATFMQEQMGARLEAQRREIADAIRAADERAGGAYRPRLASLPELLPIGDVGAPADDEDDDGEDPTRMMSTSALLGDDRPPPEESLDSATAPFTRESGLAKVAARPLPAAGRPATAARPTASRLVPLPRASAPSRPAAPAPAAPSGDSMDGEPTAAFDRGHEVTMASPRPRPAAGRPAAPPTAPSGDSMDGEPTAAFDRGDDTAKVAMRPRPAAGEPAAPSGDSVDGEPTAAYDRDAIPLMRARPSLGGHPAPPRDEQTMPQQRRISYSVIDDRPPRTFRPSPVPGDARPSRPSWPQAPSARGSSPPSISRRTPVPPQPVSRSPVAQAAAGPESVIVPPPSETGPLPASLPAPTAPFPAAVLPGAAPAAVAEPLPDPAGLAASVPAPVSAPERHASTRVLVAILVVCAVVVLLSIGLLVYLKR